MVAFEVACSQIEKVLDGGVRGDIAAEVSRSGDLAASLLRLRDRMRRHDWSSGRSRLTLDRWVRDCDRRTRAEGLHALHDWDGKADRVNDDSIPVDVLNFIVARRGGNPPDPTVAAILIDYYFLYLLALLSLRVWDGGDPCENLDRLADLLDDLQGPNGSGQLFAADGGTLILIATSHFEVDERGYALLLERVRSLTGAHRAAVARSHAASIGCHLRFGFEATYARDTVAMRDDNVADYPWLCFSLATLMDEYARLREQPADTHRAVVVEAMLNGLSADARAFVGAPARPLATCEPERARFAGMFSDHRDELLEQFERYRPSDRAYSPLSFFFNFSHNVLKGTIVDALLRARPWKIALNDLLTARMPGGDDRDSSQEALAMTLMGYARAAPDRIRGRLMPVIVYDPSAGRQAFTVAMQKLA